MFNFKKTLFFVCVLNCYFVKTKGLENFIKNSKNLITLEDLNSYSKLISLASFVEINIENFQPKVTFLLSFGSFSRLMLNDSTSLQHEPLIEKRLSALYGKIVTFVIKRKMLNELYALSEHAKNCEILYQKVKEVEFDLQELKEEVAFVYGVEIENYIDGYVFDEDLDDSMFSIKSKNVAVVEITRKKDLLLNEKKNALSEVMNVLTFTIEKQSKVKIKFGIRINVVGFFVGLKKLAENKIQEKNILFEEREAYYEMMKTKRRLISKYDELIDLKEKIIKAKKSCLTGNLSKIIYVQLIIKYYDLYIKLMNDIVLYKAANGDLINYYKKGVIHG